MYPYFQKNQKPNPSNSSKLSVREASPADPLRQFLAENPEIGRASCRERVSSAVPIERATVVISKALPSGHTLSVTTMTNESGKTAEISLPAPRRDKSQTPGGTDVFATYDALISAPGTVPVVVHNIPIFDGITTIQPVALSFDVSGARRDEAESITDTEPNL